MRPGVILSGAILWALVPSLGLAAFTPPTHPLFADDAVHEIHLTFHQPAWWDSLVYNFENFEADPLYLVAEFHWEDIHFDSIGVRFKGFSSYYGYPSNKKSFKLDIDEYIDSQHIYGLDKLNLNNGFMDPSFVREKCCYELCQAAALPTERTNYVALYINDTYWGLYTLVEQLDQQFIESRFGSDEAGNLWKGEPHGTLEYLGPHESSYYGEYELRTNEEENDWSALVELVDALNNTSISDLSDGIPDLAEINSALIMLAVDNLTVNLDSYAGRGGNYYFYHRDLDSRFVFAEWDLNEAWGIFSNIWDMSVHQLKHLDPFWVNPILGEHRPLAERLWQVNAYKDIYLGHMRKLMAKAAQPDTLLARMEELRDLIRPYVYADTKKMFTDAEFEAAMTTDIIWTGGANPRTLPGLERFIRDRNAWLQGQIGTWSPMEGLVLNELMARNSNTTADENGDFDDWIEIANHGTSSLNLCDLSLSDNVGDLESYFVFPDLILGPGEYILVWADNEPEQGNLHAPFKLDSGGEEIYLLDGGVVFDQVTFPALGFDQSYGRFPDGSGDWQLLSESTPGAENQNPQEPEEIVLYINEFLAVNDSVSQDEAGEYDDWVEIYNPGPNLVEMGGLFLTDDLSNRTKWSFPDTTLEAESFLLVWCDGDQADGPLHTNFALSGDGEEIGLLGRLEAGNEEIDSHVFGEQSADVSEGRQTDGGDSWVFFTQPTPGSSNIAPDPPPVVEFRLLVNYPNPFNLSTRLDFEIPQEGHVKLELFSASGRRVAILVDGYYDPGEFYVTWDGRDETGGEAASGIYIARMVAKGFSAVQKVALLK